MSRPPLEPLDYRARRLLRALIAQYIRDGAPVGSRTLSKAAGIDLSPATIRNVLADLEDSGLLASPHSSAGRIPTRQAYRLFVETMIEVDERSVPDATEIREALPEHGTTADLVRAMSDWLAATTQCVGLVSVPARDLFAFRQIDFVSLSPKRLLVVVVFADGEVQNRVVEPSRPFEPAELEQLGNYMNREYAGRTLGEIKSRLVDDLRQASGQIQALMNDAVAFAEQAFSGHESDVMVAGQNRLLTLVPEANAEKLARVFETFQRKSELLELLERCQKAPGVQLFIGDESGVAPLEDYAVVTAPYRSGGKTLGVLGVLGPTRMAYERVIPVVKASAELLGEVLGGSSSG